jgi:hypothetical protein
MTHFAAHPDLAASDPVIADIIQRETERQACGLEHAPKLVLFDRVGLIGADAVSFSDQLLEVHSWSPLLRAIGLI